MQLSRAFPILLLAGTSGVPAFAQAAEEPVPAAGEPSVEDESEAIVVTGERLRGAVLGDIPPEVTLDEEDIRTFGAGSLAELLEALAPQTQSARGRGGGRPVILLNGRRISGFSEIRDLPPEAVERVDILPEEVALRYGYPADQRVVNFVLRENFRAVTAELEYGMPTAGGRESYEADLNYLTIAGPGRFSFDIEAERDTFLFESERDLVQTVPDSVPADAPLLAGLGDFRTLLPFSDRVELNTTYSRAVTEAITATLNARLNLSESESRFGLPSALLDVPAASPFAPGGEAARVRRFSALPGPLTRDGESAAGHVGLAVNGDLLPWRWSVTANWDRSLSESLTDTGLEPDPLQARIDALDPALDPFGQLPAELLAPRPRDFARSVSEVADAEAVANGPLVGLPAGTVTASLKAGAATRGFRAETVRFGAETETFLSRDQVNGQASFDVPVASVREGFLAAVGDLSANLNLAVTHLSDFGTLRTIGYGFNWQPAESLSVIASATHEEGAPTIQQLGSPVLFTPNVRVFDFTRGETVDITRIEGGNPALAADDRRVLQIGATWRPLRGERDLALNATYTNTTIESPIAEFPTATPEIEAAFPDRFVRDDEGELQRIDARPVNFARARSEQLRWGFNFSAPVGAEPERREGGARPQRAGGPEGGRRRAEGRGGRGRGPGGGRFGRGDGRGRLFASIHHTWRFEDEVLIREGVPVLDFLGGSAVGNRGGRPANEIQLRAGVFRNGMGARLSANWQSDTFVRGAPGPAGGTGSDLFFSDLATVDLRLFADLGQRDAWVRDHPWLRGMRVSLALDNLFDQRLDVRDEAGLVPVGFQPALIDPLGRTFRISLRKQFW